MTDHPVVLYVFLLSNVAILAGYLFLSLVVAPRYRVHLLVTKVGAVGFFALCGLTHAGLAYYSLAPGVHDHGESRMASHPGWMVAHLVQAICVWLFVGGLYVELGRFGGVDVTPRASKVPEQRRSPE